MSETVMFTGGGSTAGKTPANAIKAFDKDSQQYIHYLASMIHSEPVIERCFEVIVANTLAKGINCRTINDKNKRRQNSEPSSSNTTRNSLATPSACFLRWDSSCGESEES